MRLKRAKSSTEFPMQREASFGSRPPTARLMETVVPHGESDDDDGQHVHQLASDGDSRDRCGAIEETCDEEVGHAVERLQKTGEKVRDGESHHLREQGPLGKIDSGHGILFVQ